jgi:anti-anti-sigma regulatory factor
METQYKIVLEQHPAEQYVNVLLNGKFDEQAVPEIERCICEAQAKQDRVYIDLSEVTLLDRKTAEYFSARALNGIRLVNCPAYLRRWVLQVSDDDKS